MATMADTLENKGETTSERFLTCSWGGGGGSCGNHSAPPFQKSWEISIKTGFDHVIEAPHQIKKKQIKLTAKNDHSKAAGLP